mmetsp:Transcript_25717/g.39851  ORF Transcript_25717/g.39851 Transcript_25717/m.39851 type:complete len:392 (-) Transcript_25717:123-1298(-)|eukprot:CAMPEP_0196812532 /NCGR_PEP_ID=MMETSP1362-20130617/27632_1 /TAXON_ID=163516 /ORGANISM="Leptocylindrus danicus, Strain CCMP1856" /LENGTH=391 /DNA_ID=CAMNT_0042188241 /DNA_START=87 /DNA_END=1262 /DNA_ORIENTATION=+
MVTQAYSVHQHLVERNWVALEVDLCLSASQQMIKERFGNSRSLPLHLAIQYQAPEKLLLNMLSIYPQAAHVKTNNGDLPLHVCCKFGASDTVVEALLLEFPEAITIKTTCKIGSVGFVTARDLAQRNPSLSRQVKVLLEKPVSHWINLASHEKVMREKSFEGMLSGLKAELERSKQNEAMLLDRLDHLERRLSSVETSSRRASECSEKFVVERVDGELVRIANCHHHHTSMSSVHAQDSYMRHKKSRLDANRIAPRRVSTQSVPTNHCNEYEQASFRMLQDPDGYRRRRASLGSSRLVDDPDEYMREVAMKGNRRSSRGRGSSMERRRSARGTEEMEEKPRRRGSLSSIGSAFARIRRSSLGRKSEEKARENLSNGAAAAAGFVVESIIPF